MAEAFAVEREEEGVDIHMGEPAEALGNPKDKLVLIADDDENVLAFLEEVVNREGFQVQTAKDGEELLRKLTERAPDLIITDVKMPGQGGYEALRTIQGTEAAKVPVIVITGSQFHPSTVELIRGEGNVVDFISKPVQIHVLLLALHSHLKTKPPEISRLGGFDW